MSKLELILSKLRSVLVLVSIGAFAFFVITFAFAVIYDKINFTTGVYDLGYKTLLIICFTLFFGGLVSARVIDLFLQREGKLIDVSEYRKNLKQQQQEELSFSQTKIYNNIIKTKKSQYTEKASLEESTKIGKEIPEKPESIETESSKDIITNKNSEKTDYNKLNKSELVEIVSPKKPQIIKIVTKTKIDIIKLIAASGEISKNKSNKFLAAFSKVITEELINGGEVELTGLGKMITIVMPAKDAVNPQTQQKIIVPSHKQVRLRFLDEFKINFNSEKG